MRNNQSKSNIVNWIATILSILLGIIALTGWIKESGKNQAVQDSIASQTQKQWELRQSDQKTINKLECDVCKLQESMEWMKKSHKMTETP